MQDRQTGNLHWNRWSIPAGRYYITVCTKYRRSGLQAESVTDTILASVKKSEGRSDTETFAGTVMPDHVHWLFRLGARLSLGRVVARLKAETKHELAKFGLEWQRDFFERRLRAEDSAEPFGFYIFMNPYWDGVVAADKVWRGWWCPKEDRFEFMANLNSDGTPPTKWLEGDPRAGRKAKGGRSPTGTQQDCAPTGEKPA